MEKNILGDYFGIISKLGIVPRKNFLRVTGERLQELPAYFRTCCKSFIKLAKRREKNAGNRNTSQAFAE